MSGVEAGLLKIAQAVVVPAATRWLHARRIQRERTAPLAELLHQRITDEFSRRRAQREIEAVVDEVATRLRPLLGTRFRSVPENEVTAALDAVADTLLAADLSDAAVFATDLDPARLVRRLREAHPEIPERAALSPDAHRLYDLLLDDCCVSFLQLVRQVAPFPARADVELLGRTTDLATALDGVSGQVRELLGRLPIRTLDAPAGTDQDGEFLHRYLEAVAANLDDLELFGVDLRRFRPRTTLSVAYVSLSVSGERRTGRSHLLPWDPGALRHARPDESSTVRVEQALGEQDRMLVRGEAGAGKSTLLRWLAVTAARHGFTGALADWNGGVPFVVKLRSYADRPLPRPEQLLDGVADALVGLMPSGWVHRQFTDGRALLLVDGVDELPDTERQRVRTWLRNLLHTYPDQRVVVTSRPAAASTRWLEAERFGVALLERMSPPDTRALIRHWHEAVRDAGSLPCQVEDLPRYESALLARLDANAHLRQLASSPLLCAMLCALNLDRDTHLPRDRMGIYQAATDMLLDRRDTERGVRVSLPDLTARDRLHLLQDVAWRLSLNGRTELPGPEVAAGLTRRLAGMHGIDADGPTVLRHLVERSGVLREPVAGRVDFVHRTFQEYLTAQEIAAQGHLDFLVNNAHRDSWREVVVMTASHAGLCSDLVGKLLDRADAEDKHRRTLVLVAAACLETLPGLDPPELLARLQAALAALVPPRRRSEARSLAAVGEPLLGQLPSDLADLTDKRAAATVRAAALVNGPKALRVLRRYAEDPRSAVQRELARVWKFFDPDEYVDRVLAYAPLDNGAIEIRRAAHLPASHRLTQAREVTVRLEEPVDPALLVGVPALRAVFFIRGWRGDLSPLGACTDLERLVLGRGADQAVTQRDLGTVSRLGNLEHLVIVAAQSEIEDLTPLAGMSRLAWLRVPAGPTLRSLAPLASIPTLHFLDLDRYQGSDYAPLRGCPSLSTLGLSSVAHPADGLVTLAASVPQVSGFAFEDCAWLDSLAPLAHHRRKFHLTLNRVRAAAVLSLATLHNLASLTLGNLSAPDLTPLRGLRNLKHLYIWESETPVDLAPLAEWPGRKLTVELLRKQQVVNAELLGSNVRVKGGVRLRTAP